MVTADQYINRLVEWVSEDEIEEVIAAYEDILEHNFSPAEAFEMVINL